MIVPEAPSSPGRLIVLEGPDGSGKSTQVKWLTDWLHRLGYQPVACRDPGGTALGDRLRALLLGTVSDPPPIDRNAEMLLFMASRAQLVAEVIQPALNAGQIVVSDRFLLSNVVYQGYAGGLDVEAIWEVGAVATSAIRPDRTLILDLDPEQAHARLDRPHDRLERRPDSYRRAVSEGYRQAARDPRHAPWLNARLIPADGPPETVFAQIREEVAHVLGCDPGP